MNIWENLTFALFRAACSYLKGLYATNRMYSCHKSVLIFNIGLFNKIVNFEEWQMSSFTNLSMMLNEPTKSRDEHHLGDNES